MSAETEIAYELGDYVYEIRRMREIDAEIKEKEEQKKTIAAFLISNMPEPIAMEEGDRIVKVQIRKDPYYKVDFAALQQIDPELAESISKSVVDAKKIEQHVLEGFFEGAAASTLEATTKAPWVQITSSPKGEASE
jgi:hypothetical protein